MLAEAERPVLAVTILHLQRSNKALPSGVGSMYVCVVDRHENSTCMMDLDHWVSRGINRKR